MNHLVRFEITHSLSALYKTVSTFSGKLAHHTVKSIKGISSPLQNSYAAAFSLVGANIVFFEIALLICRLANHVLNKRLEFDCLAPNEKYFRERIILVFFIGIVGAANAAFCAGLSLPLKAWKVALISISTCLIHLIVRNQLQKHFGR